MANRVKQSSLVKGYRLKICFLQYKLLPADQPELSAFGKKTFSTILGGSVTPTGTESIHSLLTYYLLKLTDSFINILDEDRGRTFGLW